MELNPRGAALVVIISPAEELRSFQPFELEQQRRVLRADITV